MDQNTTSIGDEYTNLSSTGLNCQQNDLANRHSDVSDADIRLIPLDSIHVINPRQRGKRMFQQITANISEIGLKKPITVRKRVDGDYELVCGQGRLEAFRQLGQEMVPAIIRDVSTEDALIMSLVENIARKNPSTMETVRQLAILRDRGYSHVEIAKKTGIAQANIGKMLTLYDQGEEHLLNAVDAGRISLSAAMIISCSDHGGVQAALMKALEEKKITYSELRKARSIADTRRAFGKAKKQSIRYMGSQITSESVVRAFRREQEKQRLAVKKAQLCEDKLMFAVNALRMLFRDENFVNLLRAESLETLPEYLAEQIRKGDTGGRTLPHQGW